MSAYFLFHDVYSTSHPRSGPLGRLGDQEAIRNYQFGSILDRVVTLNTEFQPHFTLDDGGANSLLEAAPLLEARGLRATFFVVSGWVGQPGFLSKDGLRELLARGHRIGNHTADHPSRIDKLPKETARESWYRGRAQLEDLLGGRVTEAAIPFGRYSPIVAEAAAETGHALLFTSEPTLTDKHEGGMTVRGRYGWQRGMNLGRYVGMCNSPLIQAAKHKEWQRQQRRKRLLGR